MTISGVQGLDAKIFTQAISNESISEQTIQNEKPRTSFSDIMDTVKDGVDKVNESQIESNNKIEALIKGEDVSMHEVMLALQEAQMSMQLMLEVRNQMYEAYQEVNRVQM